jgi:hypothetical protein
MRRGALCGKGNAVGRLELDLEDSCMRSVDALRSQLMRPTCGSVVKVLVDELQSSCQRLIATRRVIILANSRRWTLSRYPKTQAAVP